MINTYPYLFAVLLGLPALLAGYVFAHHHRRMMALCGLFTVLFFPLAAIHQVDYWNPQRLGGWILGIEDVICCFSLGSLVWLAAVFPLRSNLSLDLQGPRFLKRTGGIIGVNIPIFLLLRLTDTGAVTRSIIVQFLVAFEVLLLRRALWPLALWAAIIYTPYYCLVLFSASWIFSDFFTIWNGYSLWGPRIFQMPIDEIVWVISYAVSFPLIVAFAAEAHLSVGISDQKT